MILLKKTKKFIKRCKREKKDKVDLGKKNLEERQQEIFESLLTLFPGALWLDSNFYAKFDNQDKTFTTKHKISILFSNSDKF